LEALRQAGLGILMLVVALAFSSPALAQSVSAGAGPSSASSHQYADNPSTSSSPALADGVKDAADNAGRGAEAANDALSGVRSSDGKVAGLTELPDTSGAPLYLPVAGALLVSAGLLFRRTIQ
jgi:hypothetical protein